MALKAFKPVLFKAKIVFIETGEEKEVTFHLPRSTDIHMGAERNQYVDNLYTICNMAEKFDTPVPVELNDGSIINAETLSELIALGISINISDVITRWSEEAKKSQEEKERLVKKPVSGGNSTRRGTPENPSETK